MLPNQRSGSKNIIDRRWDPGGVVSGRLGNSCWRTMGREPVLVVSGRAPFGIGRSTGIVRGGAGRQSTGTVWGTGVTSATHSVRGVSGKCATVRLRAAVFRARTPVECGDYLYTGYSKTFNQYGQEKEAIRVLPQALSYLLLAYLLVVRPFKQFLWIQMTKSLPEAEFLLFYDSRVSKAFSSRVLSRSLKNLTHKALGFRLGLHGWRHLAQAFIRYGLSEDPLAYSGNESDEEALGAEQMHHSKLTGLKIYGRQTFTLQNLTPDHQSSLIHFSQRWHEYLGLGPNQVILNELFYPQRPEASEPRIADGSTGAESRVTQVIFYPKQHLWSNSTTQGGLRHLHRWIESLLVNLIIIWEESTDETLSPRLVVVQIESLLNPRFYAFARELAQKGYLDRIIWDECHLISLAKGYRLVMHRVKQALALPVPMVFSSADPTATP
ncbi:uncharacterized protein ATNIH1004_008067 [Aspergillus tanneri]|uniref:Uncharacterized protein n=1 Tax=Aspergillus tanneri TaxID=1220188 RepID=A0A5M9MMJ5_9EURO|nr:uncharacterized protein ATNIH1004_008067 [Aspergillus tanneri]KAA8646634.1 hypothetical protein ATNIH1004_008067 [Aspergillus tanneri]